MLQKSFTLILLFFSCFYFSGQCQSQCQVDIPNTAEVITADANVGGGDTHFWVCQRKGLTMFGSNNVVFAENYANILGGGSSNTIYLKNGAIFNVNGGSGNTVYYEKDATLVLSSGSANNTILCSSIEFDYNNAPILNVCCPEEVQDAPLTVPIPSSVKTISGTQTSSLGNTNFWVCPQTSLTIKGGSNRVFAENSTIVVSEGSGNTIYLKNYSTFDAQGSGNHFIIREPKAVANNTGPNSTETIVPIISFDYTNAPPNDDCCAGPISSSAAIAPSFNFKLYPNPNQGDFFIQLTTPRLIGKEVNIKITDINGEKVMDQTKQYGQDNLELRYEISNFSSGMYFINLSAEGFSQTRKLIVL